MDSLTKSVPGRPKEGDCGPDDTGKNTGDRPAPSPRRSGMGYGEK